MENEIYFKIAMTTIILHHPLEEENYVYKHGVNT